jgi:hypothetical protein
LRTLQDWCNDIHKEDKGDKVRVAERVMFLHFA